MTTQNRSFVSIRAVDEDRRIVEGIATTAEIARDGDIIEPKGIKYTLPLKLLEGHDSDKPIGHVIDVTVEGNQVRVRAKIAESGVADYVDEAWRKIKARLLDCFSIGWRTIDGHFDKSFGGYRHTSTDWCELSVVAVPADPRALITSVRTANPSAATGSQTAIHVNGVRVNTPAALGNPTGKPHMTIKEQITALEAKRAASDSRLTQLVDLAASESRTFEDTENEEYQTLEREVEKIDDHLQVLRKREAQLAKTATPVTQQNTATPAQAAATRNGSGVQVIGHNLPKGIGMARYAICMYKAGNIGPVAADLARMQYPDMPELEQYIRAAVQAGDTTTSGWASQLYPAAQQLPNEFLGLLRPMTVLGRIPLRTVPFNVAVPVQSGGGTYQWVAEAAGKPVTKPTFTSVTLRHAKAAGIIVITKELAKFSSPSAELVIRDEMLSGLAEFFDSQFLGSAAAVSNVSPAGILNGISPVVAGGTTADDFRFDMTDVLTNFAANKQKTANLVIIMSSTNAIGLSLLTNALGQPEFPGINVTGGTIVGLPVIVSETVGNNIIVCNPREIFYAEDGGMTLDVSDQATVEMETTPAVGEESPLTAVSNLKSFWQNNLVGFRVESFRTWVVGRTSAVEYISGAGYTTAAPA